MLLKTLTEAMGPSGFETEIRNVIRDELRQMSVTHHTDVLGNVIAQANSRDGNMDGPRVMIDAHMDEVGLMIVHIEDSGLLKFRSLGGIDPRVLISKPVIVGSAKQFGVIGCKPIHLQSPEERNKPLKIEELYIDIGANSKNDALSYVSPGDVAVFTTQYEEMGEGCAKAKSFDDRIGCAIVLETLRSEWRIPVFGAFTVQEEIGLRGATTAAYAIQPDIAIALEGTVCFDVAGAPGHGQSTILGAGPALTVQDGRTLADRRFLQFMIEVATRHGIPYQFRRVKGGSNDYGAIHQVREGIIGGAISVPVRYIHAPSQLVSLQDYQNAIRLLKAILSDLEEGRFTL